MRQLYSIGIYIAHFVVKVLAHFNPKLKLGVEGRKATFNKLENAIKPNDKTFWFHCASLGEYEQGLPVFEALKHKHPDYKVVVSFFSPSGYEVRKNTKIADVVVYLPFDTKSNAKRFLDIVQPDYTIFVKYEIWPNLLTELKKRQLKAILISAVFRKSQSFFKWYGKFMTASLFAFNHIFTQDKNSKALLKTISYTNTTVAGDTRFDRVTKQLQTDNTVNFIENFIDGKQCIVFGSTWPEDYKLFLNYINTSRHKDFKYIIAPHNVKPSYIASLKTKLKVKTICFSEMKTKGISNYDVFIVDTIGFLSRIYSYANIVYIGGAAGQTGLHNILEPAVFGKPILIGKNYNKFPEAKALISLGGVISVSSSVAFEASIISLVNDKTLRSKTGKINKNYIEKNQGAVVKILNFIKI